MPDTITIVEKVLFIQKFIRDTIAHATNDKASFTIKNSVSLQYLQDAINKKIVPECGAYTQMMNLFFYANDIQFRRVGVCNIPDTNIGCHVFSEVYLSEVHQWMYTDMNTNKLCLQDSNGNYLNTQQIQTAIASNNFSSIVSYYENDSIKRTSWQLVKSAEQRCFLPMVDYTYYYMDHYPAHIFIANKIRKLFIPMPWYVTVSQSYTIHNYLYWSRICITILAVLCAVILLIKILIK